jgi:hypothetical protein
MRQRSRDRNRLREILPKWIAPEPFLVPIRAMSQCGQRRYVGLVRGWESSDGRCLRSAPFLLFALFFVTGCSTPVVRQQRLVAKPNMLFTDLAAFSYNSPKLLPQLAPGFAGSGGAQNSGCTSCR